MIIIKQKYIFIGYLLLFLIAVSKDVYASGKPDSIYNNENYIYTKSDSQTIKTREISIAPIIVFSILGAAGGGAIGEAIDHPKEPIEGEFKLINYSKGGIIGCITGCLLGGYIGYLFAKRDAKHEIEKLRKKELEKLNNDVSRKQKYNQ